MNTSLVIEKVLKNPECYSLKDLKQLMHEKKCSFLTIKFLNYLNKTIMNPLITDKKYLLRVFEYIALIDREVKQNNTHFFIKVNKVLKNLRNIAGKENEDCELLKQIIIELENLLPLSEYDLKTANKQDSYSLLNWIIFTNHNEQSANNIIKNYPDLVNITDNNNQLLVVKVINFYLKTIIINSDNIPIGELIYLDHILDLFLFNPKIVLTNTLKDKILNKIEIILKSPLAENIEVHSWLLNLKGKMVIITDFPNLKERYRIAKDDNKALVDEKLKSLIINGKEKREEVKNFTIAIDKANSHMIDDAISFKILDSQTFLISIHITEVASQINYDKIIMNSIIDRGLSISEDYRIMPKSLENKISLQHNIPRMCKTYNFIIDLHGNVVGHSLKKEIIKLDSQLSINLVNDIIAIGKSNSPLEELVLEITDAINILKTNNPINPLYMLYKRKNQKQYSSKSLAENIVETCMLLTNGFVAKNAHLNKIPFIYRNLVVDEILKKEASDILNNLDFSQDFNKIKFLANNLIDKFPDSHYSHVNLGHSGLNIDSYGQITAPGRRGVDIVNEYAIDTCIFNNPTNQEVYDLEEYVKEKAKTLELKYMCINEYSKKYALNKKP